MYGDGRSRVFWKSGDQKPSLGDRILGRGIVTAARYRLATFSIGTFYCEPCRKMIFETEIG